MMCCRFPPARSFVLGYQGMVLSASDQPKGRCVSALQILEMTNPIPGLMDFRPNFVFAYIIHHIHAYYAVTLNTQTFPST